MKGKEMVVVGVLDVEGLWMFVILDFDKGIFMIGELNGRGGVSGRLFYCVR